MLKTSMGAACATVLVALAGGLVTPTASHAAIYGGVFDPENANYKWFGNHVFNVSDACLVGDGWKRVNAIGYGGCGSASLSGGDLTVVNKLGTLSLLDDVSKTLQFGSFPAFIPNTSNVWGVNIVGGELVGVDTFEIGDFTFANPGTTHLGAWTLQWSSGLGGFCSLYFCPPAGRPGTETASDAPGGTNAAPNSATVSLRNYTGGPGAPPVLNPNVPLTSDEVTFQRIPEPGTAALVLAALGAAGVLTRRRKP